MRIALVIALALAACATAPAPVEDARASVLFEGYTTNPAEKVELQVQHGDGAWVALGATTTTTTPSYFNDPHKLNPLFYWSYAVAPGQAVLQWPIGDSVHVRAARVDAAGNAEALPTFDEATFALCYERHRSEAWAAMEACAGGPHATEVKRAGAPVQARRVDARALQAYAVRRVERVSRKFWSSAARA
jgi:hypothetical protein